MFVYSLLSRDVIQGNKKWANANFIKFLTDLFGKLH